jgi:prolyl-tRNA synthetase
VEAIVREEMNNIGGLEVNLPILQPKELWVKTGRWDRYQRDGIMFTLRDRHS